MLTLLQHSPVLTLCSAAFLGLCVGSFLNVVIHRLPIMMERDWRAQCLELGATAWSLWMTLDGLRTGR